MHIAELILYESALCRKIVELQCNTLIKTQIASFPHICRFRWGFAYRFVLKEEKGWRAISNCRWSLSMMHRMISITRPGVHSRPWFVWSLNRLRLLRIVGDWLLCLAKFIWRFITQPCLRLNSAVIYVPNKLLLYWKFTSNWIKLCYLWRRCSSYLLFCLR